MSSSPGAVPPYVIGIGSQRAGSTLLHRILAESTPVVMHPLKELHFFDTADGVRPIAALHRYCRHLAEARASANGSAWRRWRRLGRPPSGARDQTVARTIEAFLKCESAQQVADLDYRELFRPLASDTAVVGEITPEYMLLSHEGLRRMHDTIGADARLIMMRRDPVQRFISSYYLSKHYLQEQTASPLNETELLDAVRQEPHWVLRQWDFSDYEFALDDYRKVFPHVLDIELEHLVAAPSEVADTLSRFLDLDVDAAAVARLVQRKANEGVAFPVSDEVRHEILYKLELVKALRREAAAARAAGDS